METLVAATHIFVAILLIILVLVQDSKGGSLGGAFGGGGSNSVFGATGATTLAQKLTRYAAFAFAVTCVSLTVFSTRSHKSVIDATTTQSVAPQTAPAPSAPVAPTESVPPTDNK